MRSRSSCHSENPAAPRTRASMSGRAAGDPVACHKLTSGSVHAPGPMKLPTSTAPDASVISPGCQAAPLCSQLPFDSPATRSSPSSSQQLPSRVPRKSPHKATSRCVAQKLFTRSSAPRPAMSPRNCTSGSWPGTCEDPRLRGPSRGARSGSPAPVFGLRRRAGAGRERTRAGNGPRDSSCCAGSAGTSVPWPADRHCPWVLPRDPPPSIFKRDPCSGRGSPSA